MDYTECLDYMFHNLSRYYENLSDKKEFDFSNVLLNDKLFDFPHKKYKTIHIAGTNGKGSTSNLIAAILQKSGYKVGLYTSPHLVDYEERIRVNGVKIPQEYVIDFINKIKANTSLKISFFEATMMMAFCYFRDENVDIAVIETGVGGLLDSTNIILPDLSIITNISLDHTHLLGKSLKEIATQKAGIIKDNTPVIIGEADENLRDVFLKTASSKKNVKIVFAQDEAIIKSGKIKNGKWFFESEIYPNLVGDLSGYAQIKNANTILCSIKELRQIGYNISDEAIYEAFENLTKITGFMGRWQRLSANGKNIILDIGHNVAGIEYVASQLNDESYKNLHIIFGVVKDKDIASILSIMPQNAKYYFTKAKISRALDVLTLEEEAKRQNLLGGIFDNVENAISSAINNYQNGDLIFIGGSNFIVADALKFLYKKQL